MEDKHSGRAKPALFVFFVILQLFFKVVQWNEAMKSANPKRWTYI